MDLTVGINDSTTTQEKLLGFNVLILDSATVAIAVESATATVIEIDLGLDWELTVCCLDTLAVGFNKGMTQQPFDLAVKSNKLKGLITVLEWTVIIGVLKTSLL